MLTLQPHPENTEIARLVQGSKKMPVYWHPVIQDALMNEVAELSSFNTPYLRDRFELSTDQSNELFKGLKENKVVEKLQQKYFRLKTHINSSLLTEMDLSGDSQEQFVIPFEPDITKYSGHHLICSGTGSGKTYHFLQLALYNLKGPKRNRRKFIIFSAEWNTDRTLAELKKERYRPYVHGVDCSEQTFRDSQWNTPEDFFKNEIKLRCDHAEPSTVILFDDLVDQVGSDFTKHLVNKLLRTARHQGVTVFLILHNLRSSTFSTQAHNSIKYITLFPRSQKGKLIKYLNSDLGIPLAKARDHIFAFSQSGRAMTVRLHAPEALIGPRLIRLI